MHGLADTQTNAAARRRWIARILPCAVLLVLMHQDAALGYIGPGAGFAVGTTLFAFVAALFSSLVAIVLWPIRRVVLAIVRRGSLARARVKRVVVLGLDGMEPALAERYMAEGKLPNLSRLAKEGCFTRLGTTLPPLSPVAWSTFLTGCNPGKHNIFDFLTRDKKTYQPLLSSVRIGQSRRSVGIGRFRLPLGKPDIRLLRRGKPFWNTL
ncbi:MAG: alkaline phosphatase family protein, partial [Phycisphaerae bacterium]